MASHVAILVGPGWYCPLLAFEWRCWQLAGKGAMSGSIRRQGARSWQVRVWNRNAQRFEYFTVRGDRNAAKAARIRRLAQIDEGSLPAGRRASKVKVREVAAEWMARKATTCEPKTILQYDWCLKHILNESYGLGNQQLSVINDEAVQDFIDRLVARGLGPKSVKGITSCASQIFKLARKKNLIRFNPAESVELPHQASKPVTPPAPSAVLDVINAALARGEPDRAALIRLKAATGARRGEICGLRWSDVDIDSDSPQVTIQRAIPDLRGRRNGQPPPREPKTPKTETGIRTIGIDAETTRILREHRERSTEWAREFGFDAMPAEAYVFWPIREGPLVPYAPQSITKMFRTLAGDGGLRPHQLRHFSVTQLLAAGVPEVEVMGRHGHASASSMKPYRHYIRARDQMSTQAIGDVLDGTKADE